MNSLATIEPVDYLLIGHVTQDITPSGLKLGGTVSYAALTARAFGIKVGIVTSCADTLALNELAGIPVIRKSAAATTTFENISTPDGRIQYLRSTAAQLTLADVPTTWRTAPIVHLGPVAAELDPGLAEAFPHALLGITPQGWLRAWNAEGLVSYTDWPEALRVLPHARAAVLSIEDVRGDEEIIQEYAVEVPNLIVTEGARGARIYWNGDVRHIRPPQEEEIDPVGAGDIFAAAFFIRFAATRDPWESARVATLLAAHSVTLRSLAGVPTPADVQSSLTEIIH